VPDCLLQEMKPDNMDKEDLRADNNSVACGRCGKYHDVAVIEFDEEEGIFLCPMCHAESINCGCSDEVQMEN